MFISLAIFLRKDKQYILSSQDTFSKRFYLAGQKPIQQGKNHSKQGKTICPKSPRTEFYRVRYQMTPIGGTDFSRGGEKNQCHFRGLLTNSKDTKSFSRPTMACRCSNGCWCCRSNCTHQSRYCQCNSGKMSDSDRLLFLSTKESFDNQGSLYSHLIKSPLCPIMAIIGMLCCGNTLRKYDAAKLDQENRFDECVCCNIILSFTMAHDSKFVYPVNGNQQTPMGSSIVMINPMASLSVPVSAQSSPGQLSAKEVVRLARVEKLIKEGRISEAEMVANA